MATANNLVKKKEYMENYMKSYIPTEHTKKLQKEYGIKVEGGNIWVGR